MHHRTRPVRITVSFASIDYRAFVSAARQLRRIMGHNAPDVQTLIQFNLHDRDATGIADDYLDAIRWPNSAGRIVSLRRRRKPSRPVQPTTRERPTVGATRKQSVRADLPGDPSRN